MSHENVEIVRLAHEALNGGDVNALVALCDEAFRLDMSDRVLNPTLYEGHDGIRRFYAEVREVWASYTWQPSKPPGFRSRRQSPHLDPVLRRNDA